jgi:spore coat protein CotH
MKRLFCSPRHRLSGAAALWFFVGTGSFRSVLAVIIIAAGGACAWSGSAQLASPSDLFQVTNIWTVHLKFTPEQWAELEPKGGVEGPFGGPGGRPFFGPAMMVAPAFLKGDADHDGKLSPDEFSALGEKWFSEWDKEKSGKINGAQLRAGLESLLGTTESGPGHPGGPGRGPGPGLQSAEGKRNGMAGAMGLDFQYVHADLEFGGQLFKDVAVRYKGNNTYMEARNSNKRSFKIELNRYVKGQKLAGLTKVNLHNNVTDPSWMNEVLSHRLFRDAGVPAPRTAYARVLVTVPGKFDQEYFGLYSVVEDIDSHFAAERFGSKDGAIFKPVTPRLFADLGDDWANYNQTYDPKTDTSRHQTHRIIEFAKLVTSTAGAEFAARVGDYLDLNEFARFMAVTVWLSNMDSILAMGQNFYVYLNPKTDKFQFLPWDLDHSFGQFPMAGSQEQREKLSIQKPWRGENRFLERVFGVEAFKKIYLAKMSEFSSTIFKPERFHQQVDELAAAIRPAVKEEAATKLAQFDKVAAGEGVERVRFDGTPPGVHGDRNFGPPGEGRRFGLPPGGPTEPIKPFVLERAQSVVAQLAGKSDGLEPSGFFPGGPGGPGGGPHRGGPGGPPGGFARVLERGFLDALDANHDGSITREEFQRGFSKWFQAWNSDGTKRLTEVQLRAGIRQDLLPFPGGPGFGPPDGPPEGPPPQE